jgi:hypothetical protein
MIYEPFVPADVAAKALGIKRRFWLDLARKGIAGAYPLGSGDFRKTWIFLLSEIREAITGQKTRTGSAQTPEKGVTIRSGSPR